MTRLGNADRVTLLALAHAAIESQVAGTPPPSWTPSPGVLGEPGAAFVSVYVAGELRGCLGCIEPRGPSLADAVADLAAAAASCDPRFAPLRASDLVSLHVEISVLGPLTRVGTPDEIVIGRDGLVVEEGSRRGLLLPQVATRWAWNVPRFLEETCHKAGLSPTAWRDRAEVFRFEADVFADTVAAGTRPVS